MKAIVDRLSGELADRYFNYIESLTVDLSSENGCFSFRFGFTLRADHRIRATTIYADIGMAVEDAKLELVASVVFAKLEALIDDAIIESGSGHN